MKKLILLILGISLTMYADVKKEIEIAIDRYEIKACDMAKKQARENYDVVDMTGCTCELNDEREWQCFVRFTYRSTTSAPIED